MIAIQYTVVYAIQRNPNNIFIIINIMEYKRLHFDRDLLLLLSPPHFHFLVSVLKRMVKEAEEVVGKERRAFWPLIQFKFGNFDILLSN